VFENRVLRGIFGAKRDGVKRVWRKILERELKFLYCSPSFILVINSRRMKWAGHVARMRLRRVYTVIQWGNLRVRDHLGESGFERRIILRWIFRSGMWWYGMYRAG
jgi:hypothetical protein